jgi:acyl-coenzyme A thioesterase PaaI-like protein
MTTPREELQRTLATAPFAEIFGYVLVSIEDDSCTLRIPFRPVLERPGGIIAGPVYMVAADVSMWLAIKARYGDESSLTSSMVTHFVSTGRCSDVLCRARIVQAGRRLIFGVAECSSGDNGALLSYHTVTYSRAESRLSFKEEKCL